MQSKAHQRSPEIMRQENTERPVDHKVLAEFHYQQGNLEKALKHITADLRINHDDPESIVTACGMLTRLGRKDIADRLYVNYQERHPENWPLDSLPKYNGEGIEKDKHFFFVIAAPRSGTKWFARFLTTDETFCFHELTCKCHRNFEGHLEELSKFPVPPDEGRGLSDEIFRFLYMYPSIGRRMYHKLYQNKQYTACGNSDHQQTLTGFALAHIFPNSRFLIVLRNGFDCALSNERKFLDNPCRGNDEKWWRESADKRGVDCKTLFDVASYRWLYNTIKLIKIAEALDRDRVKIVSFEKALNRINILREIWEFLFAGNVPFDEKRAGFFIRQRINGGRQKRLSGNTIKERWQDLDIKRRDSFLRIGGPMMEGLELYKGWPDCRF